MHVASLTTICCMYCVMRAAYSSQSIQTLAWLSYDGECLEPVLVLIIEHCWGMLLLAMSFIMTLDCHCWTSQSWTLTKLCVHEDIKLAARLHVSVVRKPRTNDNPWIALLKAWICTLRDNPWIVCSIRGSCKEETKYGSGHVFAVVIAPAKAKVCYSLFPMLAEVHSTRFTARKLFSYCLMTAPAILNIAIIASHARVGLGRVPRSQ